jgi:hypothetical protein
MFDPRVQGCGRAVYFRSLLKFDLTFALILGFGSCCTRRSALLDNVGEVVSAGSYPRGRPCRVRSQVAKPALWLEIDHVEFVRTISIPVGRQQPSNRVTLRPNTSAANTCRIAMREYT